MSIIEFSQTLYDSEIGTGIRESIYLFPAIEGTHLLSLAFSVGLIVLTDLRLVGLFLRDVPAADILRQLRPWILGGFAAQFVTGTLLFWSEAANVVQLPVFWLKLFVIFLSGLNVLWFEVKWVRQVGGWGDQLVPPGGVRIAGWASLAFWSLVVISGRLIPYLSYK
jgi:hypothetical protein